MQTDSHEVMWLEEGEVWSFDDLAGRSGLPEAVLQELIDCGVLEPRTPGADDPTFNASAFVTVQSAARLRSDFELDSAGVAVALTLLKRIERLEAEVRSYEARFNAKGPASALTAKHR